MGLYGNTFINNSLDNYNLIKESIYIDNQLKSLLEETYVTEFTMPKAITNVIERIKQLWRRFKTWFNKMKENMLKFIKEKIKKIKDNYKRNKKMKNLKSGDLLDPITFKFYYLTDEAIEIEMPIQYYMKLDYIDYFNDDKSKLNKVENKIKEFEDKCNNSNLLIYKEETVTNYNQLFRLLDHMDDKLFLVQEILSNCNEYIEEIDKQINEFDSEINKSKNEMNELLSDNDKTEFEKKFKSNRFNRDIEVLNFNISIFKRLTNAAQNLLKMANKAEISLSSNIKIINEYDFENNVKY